MKRTVVASVLGMAASVAMVASSYGQGSVWLDNYNNNAYAGSRINYLSVAGRTDGTGVLVADGYHAQLWYEFSTIVDPAGNGDLLGGLLAAPVATIFSAAPGTLVGVTETIPGYASGPISFEIVAYNGADYASSGIRGHSAAFTLASIATGTTLPGYLDGAASFSVMPVVLVPEPGTLALVGLGAASLMLFRRRN